MEGRDDRIERHSCSRIAQQRTGGEGLRQEGTQVQGECSGPQRLWAGRRVQSGDLSIRDLQDHQGLAVQTRRSGEAEISEEVTPQ